MSIGNLASMARLDRLTMAIGEENFGDVLVETMRAVGDVDHIMVFAFSPGRPVRCVINAGSIDPVDAAPAASLYADDLYEADPNLSIILAQKEGPATWLELAGGKDWLADLHARLLDPCGISDMLAFTVCQNRIIYLAQLHRTGGHHFAGAQCWLLNQVGEVVAAMIRKHFSYADAIEGQNQFLIARVLTEGPAFVNITPRERLVCIGILTGHTSESIARNLSISINSVLTYRKRLYEKLGISSQNELFVRIFDSLMALGRDDHDDVPHNLLDATASRARMNGRPLAANLAFAQAFFG